DAARWYGLVKTSITTDANPFTKFVESFKLRFTRVHDSDSAFQALCQLQQTGNISLYITKFQSLALRVSDLDDTTACRLFKQGLKHDVRSFVENAALARNNLAELIAHTAGLEIGLGSSRPSKKTFNNYKPYKQPTYYQQPAAETYCHQYATI
ncbi:hypothetical protein DFQ26_002903, partial [Actinomortierella ambigua]